MTESFCVFGGGTWGTTLACLLRGKDYAVRIWEYDPEVVRALVETRTPAKLDHLRVPDDVAITNDLAEAVRDAGHWVVVTPSRGVRELARRLADEAPDSRPETVTICSKGIEAETGKTLREVFAEECAPALADRLVILSGPSHAEEVSRDVPTTVDAVCENLDLARRVQTLFSAGRFRVYTSDDVLGAELGGALKNVIAIAAGVCDGMGFGDNTRAALITRGLAEIIRLGTALGARPATFSGLTGMGDLIVTATSRHSRNRNFGELLGQGVDADEARRRIGMEVEGIYATRAAKALADAHNVEMPISAEVHALLSEGKSVAEAMRDLLSRDLKPEIYL